MIPPQKLRELLLIETEAQEWAVLRLKKLAVPPSKDQGWHQHTTRWGGCQDPRPTAAYPTCAPALPPNTPTHSEALCQPSSQMLVLPSTTRKGCMGDAQWQKHFWWPWSWYSQARIPPSIIVERTAEGEGICETCGRKSFKCAWEGGRAERGVGAGHCLSRAP